MHYKIDYYVNVHIRYDIGHGKVVLSDVEVFFYKLYIYISLLTNIGSIIAGTRSIRVSTYGGIRVGNSSANMSV